FRPPPEVRRASDLDGVRWDNGFHQWFQKMLNMDVTSKDQGKESRELPGASSGSLSLYNWQKRRFQRGVPIAQPCYSMRWNPAGSTFHDLRGSDQAMSQPLGMGRSPMSLVDSGVRRTTFPRRVPLAHRQGIPAHATRWWPPPCWLRGARGL